MSKEKLDKVIIVDDNEDIRDLLNITLEAYFQYEYLQAPSGNQAIEIIKSLDSEEIKFIVSDYNMPDGNGGVVYNFYKDNKIGCPFMLFTSEMIEELIEFKDFLNDDKLHAKLTKPADLENFVDKFKDLLKNAGEINSGWPSASDYSRINLKLLSKSNDAHVDYFIRLSAQKFVKIISKGALYDTDFIEKYQNKGINYFFVNQGDFNSLNDKMVKTLSAELETSSGNVNKDIDTQYSALHVIESNIQNLGVQPHAIKLAKSVINSSLKIINKSKNLTKLLDKLKSDSKDAYEHGLYLSYMTTAICSNMNWKTHSTLEKISMASIFHDLSLPNELYQIISQKDFDPSKLSNADRKIYDKHPAESSKTLENDQHLPEGVSQIIQQHHEQPDGSGFPKKLGALNISPMSAVFIIAEDFVHHMDGRSISKEIVAEIQEKFQEKYNKGNFKKPLEGLLKTFE
jgi:response regulator RpfG family c-di-GMP phosphodiesterase